MLGGQNFGISGKEARGRIHEILLGIETEAHALVVDGDVDPGLQRKADVV